MARHLMAVCVVCLLCAEHLPCHQHLDAAAALGAAGQTPNAGAQHSFDSRRRRAAAAASSASSSSVVAASGGPSALVAEPSIAAQRYIDTLHLPNAWRDNDEDQAMYTHVASARRQKRHQPHGPHGDHDDHDHDHDEHEKKALPARTFVQKLFERFGNVSTTGDADGHTMSVLGFERLLDRLGLYELLNGKPAEAANGEVSSGQQCISSMDLVARVSSVHPPASHNQIGAPAAPQPNSNSSTPLNQTALAAQAALAAKEQFQLNANDFAAICPILVYQLTSNTSREKAGCIDERLIAEDFANRGVTGNGSSGKNGSGQTEDRKLVWIYAMLSILIASLCGLLAVAVIPCMESDYYHYLLQFFVALGVGTLAGDALLHLFPHAMMTRSPGADEHIDMTLKGLAAAGGVAFSFLMERGLTMVAEWRKRVEKKGKPSSRVRVMRDPDTAASHQANHHNHGHGGGGHNHHHHHHHHQQQPQNAQDAGTQQLQLLPASQHHQSSSPPPPLMQLQVQSHPCNPHQPSGETVCKAKYSSYPYCYDEIDADRCGESSTANTNHQHESPANSKTTTNSSASVQSPKSSHNNHHNNHQHSSNKTAYKTSRNGADNHDHHHHDKDNEDETAESLLPQTTAASATTTNNVGGGSGDSAGADRVHRDLHLTKQTNVENGGAGGSIDDKQSMKSTVMVTEARQLQQTAGKDKHCGDDLPEENYTIILREHEAKHHGHSHTHGHVHSPPSSMSAVAWMVIMGDGMHNFTDGMAIGAAFSYNIAGGFSTALAVFCHELPHELGDFAILLKAGMSARQAVYYNVLSSVLSFIGTVIGIWIGDTPQASAWVFAAAAGIFLYIAMVDMMPELTSSHKEESFAYSQLLLQMIGIMLGIGIMLTIAVYEHDLKMIFSGGANSDGGFGN